MEQIYLDPRHPGSFRGLASFARHGNVSSKIAREWLMGQNAYTLHKQGKTKFRRRKTFSVGIDDLWQADLVDMSSLSPQNDSYKYILTCIDVFSKFARVAALKNKNGSTLTKAFAELISSKRCNMLQTDKGTEFLNAPFQKLLSDSGIKFYTSENDDIKCAVVERFNRTLKTIMWRYFTHFSTTRYIDVLAQFVDSYNNTFHRSIKMTPSQVNSQNEDEVRRRLYPPKKLPLKWKYKVGDSVRIRQSKRAFKKGYLPSWTEEIFVIESLYPSDPPTYLLKDYLGEIVKGKFYEDELQVVSKTDDVYVVERVIKSRKRGGKVEYFVKWRGYPEKFNSWVDNLTSLHAVS